MMSPALMISLQHVRCPDVHPREFTIADVSREDRMPTVSAADVLDDLNDGDNSPFISTGLDALDAALKPSLDIDIVTGGVQKAQVIEIWGPPGVGKTAFG